MYIQSDIQSMSQQSLHPGLNPNQIQMFPGLNHNMPPGYPPYGGMSNHINTQSGYEPNFI